MRLTDRILASGVSLTDLIHIVITGDTTQSPEGSSYKASISQVKSLFGDAIIITGTGVTSSIRKDSGNLASGNFSSSIPGSGNTSSGHLSYSEGENTISSGRTSHSEGSNTTAGGNNSHAEGEWTRALGVSSHAEGNTTYSIGNYSHSEGFETIARGISSHAQGDSTSAYGDYSHAGGLSSTVSGNTSFVHSKDSAVYSDYSSILGGRNNDIINNSIDIGNNVILGGDTNIINGHNYSTIINGTGNTIHFDLVDYANFNSFEMITNSRDSKISGSSNCEISSNVGGWIIGGQSSVMMGCIDGDYSSTDPNDSNCGIFNDNTSGDFGIHLLLTSTGSVIRNNGIQNTIIGSQLSRISGSTNSSFRNNFIGGSSQAWINNQINSYYPSWFNSVIGSGRISLEGANNYTSVFGSYEINMNNTQQCFIGASNESNIYSGETSAIVGGKFHNILGVENSGIFGGSGNTISGLTVSSGSSNNTAIIAGYNNLISNQTTTPGLPSLIGIGESINSTIIGGEFNNIYGHKNSSIIGGSGNTIHFDFPIVFNHTESIIASIDCNINASTISTILSSSGSSIVWSNHSSIIGGYDNNLQFTNQSSILFGFNNSIGFKFSPTENSHIFGGSENFINSDRCIILGGSGITANTSDTVYVPDLIIDGLTSTDPIATDSTGRIVAGTSDARLKQNINELTNSLDIINNLRGVSFEYTPESKMGDGIRYGFIAQEVQQYVPDIVRSRAKGDGMLSLNYNEIVPILVESVKELSSKLTLTIPVFTPTSSNDITGNEGEITRDDNYMYVKTNSGWKRSSLEQF